MTATTTLRHPLLTGIETASFNAAREDLLSLAISAGEGVQAATGAFVATTGEHTGRSPNDRFIVEDSLSKNTVDWGKVNRPLSQAHFDKLKAHVAAHLEGRKVHAQQLNVGADPATSLNIQVVCEQAWHTAFARTMLRRPSADQLESYAPDWTLIQVPSLSADPEIHGTRTGTFIVVSFAERLVLIGGTSYAGEIKKSAFSLLNFDLPAKGIMPMHCSANVGADGDAALFFGLSGTGKTTLSADEGRALIGDDEHGWGDDGIFNFEGGCYAKAIDLTAEKEPEIFAASSRPGAILENVILDANVNPDFTDTSLTENTRCAYPLPHIPGHVVSGTAAHPSNVIFLALDAFGVLPPVAKLTAEQAEFHFLNGYTAKVAGTEKGLGAQPEATFSACYGAPFMPRAPQEYANLLGTKLENSGANVWLINTGWVGGAYGVGNRISLTHTRALIRAILSGNLQAQEFWTEPAFGLAIPKACDGVPSALMNPRENWADSNAYDLAAADLRGRMAENFQRFERLVPQGIGSVSIAA